MARQAERTLLLLSQTFTDGGIQRFNRTLIAASAATAPRVDVLTLRDSPQDVPARLDGIGTLTGFGNDRARFTAAVFRAMLSGRYRLLVVGHVNMLVMAVALSRLVRRRPRLWMIAHGVEVWRRITPARAAAMRRLDLCLSVSRYTRDSILAQVPELPAARATIFPNALGETWSSEDAPGTDLALDLPQRFVLSVGRLEVPDRTKGIIATIESLAMTHDDDLHLVVAGSGSDLPFLRRVAARAGVARRVLFLGRVSDAALRELYARCLAFVLPSGQEGFGIVYLEAAFYGAPVLGARAKGVTDVIEDGETGLMVEYGDRVALTRALDRLATDELLRARLRARARAQVTNGPPFTFSAYRDRWRRLLRGAGIPLGEAPRT
jgi:phosphatidyl-myo-inositol dimannoside synthase